MATVAGGTCKVYPRYRQVPSVPYGILRLYGNQALNDRVPSFTSRNIRRQFNVPLITRVRMEAKCCYTIIYAC